jgi:nucleotide-binding universal stress UspA family protein
MSYATLLVYVDADSRPEHRVRIAVSVADKFNATLIGLSALPIPPPVVANGVVTFGPTEVDIAAMRAQLADQGNWFCSIAAADHRKLEWRPLLEFPTMALAREARSADLVVIGRKGEPLGTYSSLDPGGAILQMGRPTLVVPEEVLVLKAEHIVIGWKDTREARRAVQDALPFLHEASRVTIVEVCEPGEEKTALDHIGDVARYLTRHRINGGPRVILQKEGSGAAQLIRLALDEGADLLVTGAYGHSRFGEWMFGGMTRELLATSPICCLMSH